MLCTSIYNDFDVMAQMDNVSIPSRSRECSFSKMKSLRTKNRRPPPRILFWSLATDGSVTFDQ